jgi:hypothetical protein
VYVFVDCCTCACVYGCAFVYDCVCVCVFGVMNYLYILADWCKPMTAPASERRCLCPNVRLSCDNLFHRRYLLDSVCSEREHSQGAPDSRLDLQSAGLPSAVCGAHRDQRWRCGLLHLAFEHSDYDAAFLCGFSPLSSG